MRARRATARGAGLRSPALAGFGLIAALSALAHAVAAQTTPPPSPGRFAAVISVEDYDAALGPARGAAADGAFMGDAFADAGYQVRQFPDATAGDVRRAAFWLAENLAAAGADALGAAYFTGHAAVVNNRTYLLGRDAAAVSTRALAASGTPADVFARALSDTDAASLVLIDASARHRAGEPLGLPRGLAAFDPPPRGVVIFDNAPGAAAPGRGAGVSPFASATAALLVAPEPPRTALRAFRQRVYEESLGWRSPWISGRLPARMRLSAAPATPSLRGEPRAPARDVLFVTTRRVAAPAPPVASHTAERGREAVAGARAVVFTAEADAFTSRGWARADGVEFIGKAAFRAELRGAAVMIYVHDSGTSLRAAAQEAGDFAAGVGLGGRTIAFAWPSLDERTAVARRRDAAAAEQAAAALAELVDAVRAADAGELNIAGYGVGARSVLGALELLRARRQPPPADAAPAPPPVLHTVLIAPDVPPARRMDRLRALADMATIVTVVTVAEDPGGADASASASPAAWMLDAREAGVSLLEIDGDPTTPAPRTPELWRRLSPAVSGFAAATPVTPPPLRDAIAPSAPKP